IESQSSPGRNNPVTGRLQGSVRGGAVNVRDERAADARPARALEELLVPAPHDADRPPEEVLDRTRAEEARVAALVAIVAHEEDLALRHRDRAERADLREGLPRAVHADEPDEQTQPRAPGAPPVSRGPVPGPDQH